MLGLPLRIILLVLVNLTLLPRNLLRWLRRRPQWITVHVEGSLKQRPARRRLFRRHPLVLSLAELQRLGETLARDRRVRGVVLALDAAQAGWAQLDELRDLVAEWRRAGKRVVAHLSSAGNREYYVATACDEILIDESGPLSLVGLTAEASFYGEALRRLGVDAELEREGEYKSYAETFTRADMSPAHREALDAVLDTIHGALLEAIATGRGVDRSRAAALVDEGPYLHAAAREAGLVDGVLYRDQLPEHLGAPDPRFADHRTYLGQRPRWWWPGLLPRRCVAVVTLEGAIAPGEGSSVIVHACGAEPAVRTLSALRRDRRVAAVVLHIDSRGGSAAASDRIWRAVSRLSADKPVVAHLGAVAASGGYYIASGCQHVVAQPTTLTGSIGVVAGKLVFERLLERLSVGSEVLVRGQAAAMNSVRRRYDEVGRARLLAELSGTYRQFLDRVARGRALPADKVAEVARGRVWTGADAASRGLIDELGDIRAAIEHARAQGRRRPGERLLIRDVAPAPRVRGLLGALRRTSVGPGPLEDAISSWSALLRERVLLYDADTPEVR